MADEFDAHSILDIGCSTGTLACLLAERGKDVTGVNTGAAMNTDSTTGPRRVQQVIDRLMREGTAVSRSDGTLHVLFPVAIPVDEGESLLGWVTREGAAHTIEIGL